MDGEKGQKANTAEGVSCACGRPIEPKRLTNGSKVCVVCQCLADNTMGLLYQVMPQFRLQTQQTEEPEEIEV